ncbi:hypothetical protein SK355_00430 [Candidatus Fukatsuia symbiotica]|uniref:Ornithine carbamoyltransferase n=2 Tax=Yersiniaceae TaxID=1903411 RepID=A0A2U8I7E1_9GAMM|nr:hypothetical protein [Candidatus Fukatsuia symbiotica]AWK15027.1 hypothetical protein CCS41_12015 [Candidatus Fukatsuia symbiotica]MEA9443829.1 hypothetical protein [Candidatus Fukatsuia symbiotica]
MKLTLKTIAIATMTLVLWLSGYSNAIANTDDPVSEDDIFDSGFIPGTRISKETAPIQGRAPTISAPSNQKADAVDISRVSVIAGKITAGDSITLTYNFHDKDNDTDNSIVSWFYTLNEVDHSIPDASHVLGDRKKSGSSTIKIPPQAAGASVIKVSIQVASAYGYPRLGKLITIADISQHDDHIAANIGVVTLTGTHGGIFLATDNPQAGSGAQDYTRAEAPSVRVGQSYLFRAWVDSNSNGVWDATEADITANLKQIQWILHGNNQVATGNNPSSTLNKMAIPGATSDKYNVPVNSLSESGTVAGDQGFKLMVEFD